MLKLKSTKYYLAALSLVSAAAFASQPAFAQLEVEDLSGGSMDADIVLNLAEAAIGSDGPDFLPPPPPGEGAELAFSIPLPPPQDVVGAMRGGGFGGGPGGACPVMRRGGPGGCPLWMLDGDNAVTDEQYERFYELKNKSLDQVGPKMLDLMQTKRHLKDAMTQESIDEKAVKKMQAQIASLKSDIENIKMDGELQMMQILTAGQRKELRKAMIQGPKRPSGGMHHMMRKYMEKRESGR